MCFLFCPTPCDFISSAGIGRTGTFIALDILTEQGHTLDYVDPFGCVTTLRNQRVSMVQTKANVLQFSLLVLNIVWLYKYVISKSRFAAQIITL